MIVFVARLFLRIICKLYFERHRVVDHEGLLMEKDHPCVVDIR
jgi:hypothetical protein